MTQRYEWWVGIDWGSEVHQVVVVNAQGDRVSERRIAHSGTAIAEGIDWILTTTGSPPSAIAVAIETPRGAVVEMVLDRALAVYAINPKQLDRFRDRHTVAGAKDDRLDAYVLADSLRTDPACFRPVQLDDPRRVELRELARIDEELKREKLRLANQLREQVYRYFPQVLTLVPGAEEPWLWTLLELIPTPVEAHQIARSEVQRVLRQHRIRRLTADAILTTLRTPPVQVGPGTVAAARAHIEVLLPRLRLLETQRRANEKHIDALLRQAVGDTDAEGQPNEQRDVAIILSLPGIGNLIAATLLGEAGQALEERDYDRLRAHAGVAPVTRRTGKSRHKTTSRRYACNPRLANACYHAARVHAQKDPAARALYVRHLQQGQSHGRALRSVADRLLRVLIAMLRTQTCYDPTMHPSPPGAESLPCAA